MKLLVLLRAGLYLAAVCLGTSLLSPWVTVAEEKVAKLKCVRLHVQNIDESESWPGLTRQSLTDALLVRVKAKLPRLDVSDDCPDRLYLEVALGRVPRSGGGYFDGYFGGLHLKLLRSATIRATGQLATVTVWEDERVFIQGGDRAAAIHVPEILDGFLDSFAAAYYKAGNP